MRIHETNDLFHRQTRDGGRKVRHNDLELLQRGYVQHPVGDGDMVLRI